MDRFQKSCMAEVYIPWDEGECLPCDADMSSAAASTSMIHTLKSASFVDVGDAR